ncbi:hypothetical protein BV898_09704 [Hypsibius exemplaris]|uniref:Uncharacterized protein n=1 Tax=Hypsibius exemplaris TaxID=2072580 RepID=A0A1W0WLX4_HYPEX|nr:hypothetical protein BV898_09704 [Hypsibius exemplaris]
MAKREKIVKQRSRESMDDDDGEDGEDGEDGDREVRFSQATSLQPSSGTIHVKPVPSYREDEEGQGKRYRKKAKVERTKAKAEAGIQKHDAHPVNHGGSEKHDPEKHGEYTPVVPKHSKIKAPVGSLFNEDFAKNPTKKGSSTKAGKTVTDQTHSVGGESFRPKDHRKRGLISDPAEQESGSLTGLRSPTTDTNSTTKKPGMIRRFTDSILQPFSRKDRKHTAGGTSIPDAVGVVKKHQLSPDALHEVGLRLSKETLGENGLATNRGSTGLGMEETFAEEEDDHVDDEEDDDLILDDRHVISFISLLGVDSYPTHREATETDTEQSRIDEQTKKSAGFKATNAAFLDGMNLDSVDVYDESFLRLWDLEAGQEMLTYMMRQTESYRLEMEELDRENANMEANLNFLRRRKQDTFFQIKDLEAQAADAERRHRQLLKLKPRKKKGKSASLSSKETSEILSSMLAQRIELLCQDRDIHRKLGESCEKVQAEQYKTDKALNTATRRFNETYRHFQRALQEIDDTKANLAVVQQELNYLTEEIGLYIFEDEKPPHNVSVAEAFHYLSSQNPDVLPLKSSDPPIRLGLIQDTLKSMKKNGSLQIREVNDARDQVHFHVSRRGDILQDMVRTFMKENELLRIDPQIWQCLQAQRANGALLQEQIDAQDAVSQLLHPKWMENKEGNARLREELDRLKGESAEKPDIAEDGSGGGNPELGYHPPRRPRFKNFTDVEAASQTSRAIFNVDSTEEIWDELSMKDSASWRGGEGGSARSRDISAWTES